MSHWVRHGLAARLVRLLVPALVVVCGFGVTAPPAVEAGLPPEAARLERALEGLNSIRADFLQIRNVELTGEEIQAVGMLAFRPPQDFRLAYAEPYPQELVIRGDSLWVIVPEENQAQRYAFTPDAPGNEIFLLFGGRRGGLDEAFEVVQEAWGSYAAALRLTPRNREPGYPIEEIRLVLRKDGLPERLFFHEVTGDDVVFTFTRFVRNPKDIEDLLALRLPPGIEIIDASPTGLGDVPGVDPQR